MLTNPIYRLNSITNAVEKNTPSYFPLHFVMRATRSKRLFACIDAVAGGRQSSSPVGLQSRFRSGRYKNTRSENTGPAPWRKRDGGFTGRLPRAFKGLRSTAPVPGSARPCIRQCRKRAVEVPAPPPPVLASRSIPATTGCRTLTGPLVLLCQTLPKRAAARAPSIFSPQQKRTIYYSPRQPSGL